MQNTKVTVDIQFSNNTAKLVGQTYVMTTRSLPYIFTLKYENKNVEILEGLESLIANGTNETFPFVECTIKGGRQDFKVEDGSLSIKVSNNGFELTIYPKSE